MKQKRDRNETTKKKYVFAEKKHLACKHCKKRIDKVKLLGISLICPFCGFPQNGKV